MIKHWTCVIEDERSFIEDHSVAGSGVVSILLLPDGSGPVAHTKPMRASRTFDEDEGELL